MTMNDNTTVPSDGAYTFDVRAFARTAQGSMRDEIDTAEYAGRRLPDDVLRALRFLRDLEASTMEHLRNVLVTATHKDARVTAFLVSWAFEKFWIADAIQMVLEANDEPGSAAADDAAGRKRRDHVEAPDRRGPVMRAISAMRIGTPIVAVQMASGLIDEWITRAAYERAVEVAQSAALTKTVARLLDLKHRHSEFFEEEARRRLASTSRAARLANRTLGHLAWPLGSIGRSNETRAFFERFAFGGAEGAARAEAIERGIASLPGVGAGVARDIRERLVP
jgi:hypothetical protein